MPYKTNLPPSATFIQRLTYAPIRSFFFFFFNYVPYYPITRVNKPEFKTPYIWASSHSNLLCDVVPAGFEGPMPCKFLGKSTLFVFPIKKIIEFCGALPLVRAEDVRNQPGVNKVAQNKSTFKAATAAMQAGWPVAIYPEGVSIENPGLVLPLKPGVAKLAFNSEVANDFKLGLNIIPVGLEYGSRAKMASGLIIRYGKPLFLKDYEELYKASPDSAIKKLLEDLTHELVTNFPHFENETMLALGKKLVALGLVPNKHYAAQLFLRKKGDENFWTTLQEKMRAFDESTKDKGIPVPAWGLRKKWKEVGPWGRRKRGLFIFTMFPFAIYDLLMNSLPEIVLMTFVENVTVDETERTSYRFIFAPVILSLVFAAQFYFLKKVVLEAYMAEAGFGAFFLYLFSAFFIWYLAIHWRRQAKRMMSIFFFKRAGVDGRSEAVKHYHALRQHLSQL